jgi:DNA invertase Pin-like site-specific DNA recombinase
MTTAPKAYSYIRWSTPEQALGDSERRQLDRARAYAAQHGLDLDESMADKGVSAFHGKNARQGHLGAFLNSVEQGAIPKGSHLLVESVDRISRRDPWTALDTFKRIIDQGIVLVTLTDGQVYTLQRMRTDVTAPIILGILLTRGYEESRMKSLRVGDAWAAKRKKGTPMTRICPAWLTLKADRSGYTVNRERANLVRRMYRMYLSGVGVDGIAQTLNEEGIEPWGSIGRRAQYWNRTYIWKILHSTTVVGTYTPHTESRREDGARVRVPSDPKPGFYPAIIDSDTWQRVQTMQRAKGPKGQRTSSKNIRNLFAGLLRCPNCGGTMRLENKGAYKGHPQQYAYCAAADHNAGCAKQPVNYRRLQDAFMGKWQYLLAKMPKGKATSKLERELANTEAAIDAHEDAIENLSRAIGRNPSPALEARLREQEDALRELKAEAESLETRIEAASPKIIEAKVRDLWQVLEAPALDIRAANAGLRQLVAGITVDYRSGDMDFEWTHGGLSSVIYDHQFPKVTKAELAETEKMVRNVRITPDERGGG